MARVQLRFAHSSNISIIPDEVDVSAKAEEFNNFFAEVGKKTFEKTKKEIINEINNSNDDRGKYISRAYRIVIYQIIPSCRNDTDQ
ncbi:hypothetical protein SK128_025606 [Halocaridina rubra]|uniref:Uncharacterized protein n=1 Tax=Halocaridina rubra TaxID=373956 RepID=A0AAN8WSJ8_HALRR